jgi:hypothetical protein
MLIGSKKRKDFNSSPLLSQNEMIIYIYTIKKNSCLESQAIHKAWNPINMYRVYNTLSRWAFVFGYHYVTYQDEYYYIIIIFLSFNLKPIKSYPKGFNCFQHDPCDVPYLYMY